MRSAIWVLSGFAALWAAGAIASLGWPMWLAVIPVLVSTSLVIAAARMTAEPIRRQPGITRLILIWTMIEFVAIIVTVNVLGHFNDRHAMTPAVAIIVGLHLVPLARGIGFPPYYWAAGGLVALGTIALFLPPPLHIMLAAFGSAVTLWATAAAVLHRWKTA